MLHISNLKMNIFLAISQFMETLALLIWKKTLNNNFKIKILLYYIYILQF